jgi:gamma-glutamyl hercynylcysteine S-oxide synthase
MTDILPQPFEWVHIPAGRAILTNQLEGGMATYIPRNGELVFDLPAFDMGKYPITNAQYDLFVHHPHGYTNPKWWDFSDEARLWRTQHPSMMKTAYTQPDFPRVDVNWYDSLAFCHWLSDMTEQIITLPTETQWGRAAIADTKQPYPWGDMPLDETRANYAENIGQPTPVTDYPTGISPFGVWDMLGNVWEWTRTVFINGDNDLTSTGYRVARGGSWMTYDDEMLVAVRLPTTAHIGDYDRGFRCVRLID